MSTNPKSNRTLNQVADQKMTDGFKKHGSTLPSLLVHGTSYATADITSVFQARIDSANHVDSTRTAWQNAVLADRDQRSKSQVLASGVRLALQVAFAGSPDVLGDFGLKPRKKAIVSPDTRVAAAAKAKATRAARHTMGAKQKAQIKGTADSTAPATSPTAPAPVVSASTPVAPAATVPPPALAATVPTVASSPATPAVAAPATPPAVTKTAS